MADLNGDTEQTTSPGAPGTGKTILLVVAVLVIVFGVRWYRTRGVEPAAIPCGDCAPIASAQGQAQSRPTTSSAPAAGAKLPRLVDLGADKCIPCKALAPILEELKKEYAGRLEVEFIDVWKKPDAGKPYGIRLIPTQIFYDATGQERFRHEGFISKEDILSKWRELGVELGPKSVAAIIREVPAEVDSRPQDQVCFMCDGNVNPATRVLVKGSTEQVNLCSPHCFFIYYSSLRAPQTVEPMVSVTDAGQGGLIPATIASYLYGLDGQGRATIKAFADANAANQARQQSGGNVLAWEGLRSKELATRCGFCDRAVYPEDACMVTVAQTTHAYGCCVMCGLGVAARLQKDIEVEAKDALTGEIIKVKTLNGSVATLEPKSAVAWAGQKKAADGTMVSAGCFKQAFFANEANLKTWLEKHPASTGRMTTIGQALTAKMKLTPEQIAGACKIGECK